MSMYPKEVRVFHHEGGAGARAEQHLVGEHLAAENRRADMSATLEALAAEIGLDELLPIVEQFARDVHSCLNGLRLAYKTCDSDALQRLRHRLKGLLQQMGATDALDVLIARSGHSSLDDAGWLVNLERVCTGATNDARRIVACQLNQRPR